MTAPRKKALITGITGQDGSYLSELLLEKGYEVHGIIRRNSDFTSRRIDHIFYHPRLITHHGDLTDSANLYKLLSQIVPDEVYNLAAQSHVGLSFQVPEHSSNIDGIGVLRLLSGIRDLGLNSKFYQASTSELYGGLPGTAPQNELSVFAPRSPYAAAKLYGYWITVNYREAYNMYATNGILFNHESPRRGKTFVTKKITMVVASIAKGAQTTLKLGDLNTKRDWGYAKEYAEAMWLMLQQDRPDDFVVGTGKMHSVREFVEEAFKVIDIDIIWKGEGVNEVGIDRKTNRILVQVDPVLYRPTEVYELCADYSKVQKILNWKPNTQFKELVRLMVEYDMRHEEYGYPDCNTETFNHLWFKDEQPLNGPTSNKNII